MPPPKLDVAASNAEQTTTPERRPRRLVCWIAGLLFAAAFGPTIVDLVHSWWTRPNYSHGFLMPPVAAWILWERRDQLRRLKPAYSMLGLLLLLPCLAALMMGEMRLFAWIRAFALVAGLGALVWTLYGWKGFKAVFPALLVLGLMCPLPGRIENAVTVPLKNTAALFATGLLDLTGFQASLDGNMINLEGVDTLWIADACSGIRSLISLLSLAIMVSVVWRRHWLLKVVIVLSSIPIAVFVNGLRIWLTGYLAEKVGHEAASGFFHFFEGVALFAAAAALLGAWAWLLTRVFPKRGEA